MREKQLIDVTWQLNLRFAMAYLSGPYCLARHLLVCHNSWCSVAFPSFVTSFDASGLDTWPLCCCTRAFRCFEFVMWLWLVVLYTIPMVHSIAAVAAASATFVGSTEAFASAAVRLSIVALICPNCCDWQSFRHFQQLDLTMESASMPMCNSHPVHFHWNISLKTIYKRFVHWLRIFNWIYFSVFFIRVHLLIVWLNLLRVFASLMLMMILNPHLHWHNIYVAISWVQLCFRFSQCQFVICIAIVGCIGGANGRSAIHTLCTNGGCLNRISTANMIAFWLKRIHFITNSMWLKIWLLSFDLRRYH